MAKYIYPAIFTAEENGGYSVDFPDLENCFTCGDNLADALEMSEDVLALTLYEYERDKRSIPSPSAVKAIQLKENEFMTLVTADTMYYQKKFNNKAVKKTLTIPEWLNDMATAANINFSQTLQEALAQKLGVQL